MRIGFDRGEYRLALAVALARCDFGGDGKAPVAPLRFAPHDPSPGDPDRGAMLLRGALNAGGVTLALRPEIWRDRTTPPGWRLALHRYGWLRDLFAAGGRTPVTKARGVTESYIATALGDRLAWSPGVAAERLLVWLEAAPIMLQGSDAEASRPLLAAVARHIRFLDQVVRRGGGAARQVPVLIALACGQLCQRAAHQPLGPLETTLALIVAGLERDIHADGGHVSRNPHAHVAVFRAVVMLRDVLRAAAFSVPDALERTIDRMAPMVRFFRHGDGGLVLFNGSNCGDPQAIDALLAAADAHGKPPETAPHSGFQRLASGRTLVVMDCGKPAPGPIPHAGTLSFELSIGRERLIGNCGSYPIAGSPWRQAERASAAHSTLTLADTNSSEMLGETRLGRVPVHVKVEREESEHGIWIKAGHDGYLPRLGVVHRRRLYLQKGGDDLRGEDVLAGSARLAFAVRFHLHPSVQASLQNDGSAILLRTPSGKGWRFRSSLPPQLEPSVYMGQEGTLRSAQQIVVYGRMDGAGTGIKWALRKDVRTLERQAGERAEEPELVGMLSEIGVS